MIQIGRILKEKEGKTDLSGVDHESVGELHRLGAGGTKLARDNDLATLGARLHDEAEDTVARAEERANSNQLRPPCSIVYSPNSPTDGKTTEELVAETLALSDSIETTVLNLLGVELNGPLGELETLLDERSELANAASLLSEDLLGVGGADDDLGAGVGNANLAAGVSLRREGTGEELGELGAADAGIRSTSQSIFKRDLLEDSLKRAKRRGKSQ